MNKLEGLPKIYYINLPNAIKRNAHMVDQFKEYDISNYERYEATPVEQSLNSKLNKAQYGCLVSHLEVLTKIANGTDEFAIVMEDDVDLSYSDNWDFTWNEFLEEVGEFDVLQLILCQFGKRSGTKVHNWQYGDWCAAAYVISKQHAKKLANLYKRDKTFRLFESVAKQKGPVADLVIYSSGITKSSCIFGMKIFDSQISHDNVNEIACSKYISEILSKTITIDELFEK